MASFELAPLPYKLDALEPHISRETLEYHYGKHHRGYVNKLNELAINTPFIDQSLEEIVKTAQGAIFNNAAQIWNHDFYWQCLCHQGRSLASGSLSQAINNTFGSFDQFKSQFNKIAMGTFGSGWVWLVQDNNHQLKIISTSNAGNPLTEKLTPLLNCDVWEHAYYIDYRNARAHYLDAFWQVVNWQFAQSRFKD